MPKARAAESIPEVRSCGYPEPFYSRIGDRTKRRLGDAFALTQYGVNLVTLAPGAQSALRHWHTDEDELIYFLEGELVLVTDAGEEIVRAGDVVGHPAGDRDAHHLINRSTRPARYLEIGTRSRADMAFYPDDDLAWHFDGTDHIAYRKDGTKY
jgi:uncharacterized cupin superfamily protein